MATLVNFDTHSKTDFNPGFTQGNKIVPSSSSPLSAVKVYVFTGGTGTITVKVWSSGGSLLRQGSLTQTFTTGQTYTIPLSSSITLSGGTTYWVSGYGNGVVHIGYGFDSTSPDVHANGGYSFERTGGAYFEGDGFPNTTFDECFPLSLLIGPLSINVGLTPATENASAPSLGRTKRKAIATVTETDTTPAVARQKSKALATTTETDEAVAITATTPGIRVAIATVTETDEAPAITRTDPSGFLYRLTFPTYPRTFTPVPIGQTARFVIDQAVSIVRIKGSLRQFRSPSQTQLTAAGTEGVDWFIGGRIYEQISNDVAIELRLAGFETERVA